jgi:hypothetical protein
MPAKLFYFNNLMNCRFPLSTPISYTYAQGMHGFCQGGKAKMRTNQEKRYSRVAEGICRYKSGGFHLLHKVEGKTTSHKLKS